MNAVKKNLIDYVMSLESMMTESKEEIQEEADPEFAEEINKGIEEITKAKN